MHPGKSKVVFFLHLLLGILLASCARPSSPPALASWSEQYTSAKKLVTGLGSEFVLIDAVAFPVRDEPGPSGEPIELRVRLVFESLRATGTGTTGESPGYPMQTVKYNDHHLAATLSVEDVGLRMYAPVPAALDRAAMLQISPQDALQLTLTEGEAHMGSQVDRGNIEISLEWDASKDHPELENALVPVWTVMYFSQDSVLNFLIDAQSGEILKRYEGP